MLSNRADPSSLVVAIYVVWGEGKSSVLGMTEQALAASPHVIYVRFHPWIFGADEQLLRSFFSTFAAVLKKSLFTKREANSASTWTATGPFSRSPP